MFRFFLAKCVVVLAMVLGIGAHGQTSIADLGWMEGSWIGAMGPNTIEETWSRPSANSVQASVRISANGAVVIHEFIVISQVEDTLVLNLQQWAPGYKPIGPATTMRLEEMTENSVTFKAEEGAEIARLTYRRKDESTFEIAVTTKNAPEFVMSLTPLE